MLFVRQILARVGYCAGLPIYPIYYTSCISRKVKWLPADRVSIEVLRAYFDSEFAPMIIHYPITEFNGPDLRVLENLALDMDGNGEGNKPYFQELSEQLKTKMNAMTSDEKS